MLELRHTVAGSEVKINIVETDDDLDAFAHWSMRNPNIAIDTETTGLGIYRNDFKIRLFQAGNAQESWVLPVERSVKAAWYAARSIEHAEKLIIQNAMFDLAVIDRHWGIPLERTYPKTIDTKILAHLVDNRSAAVGGTGHSLEELTAAYIDKAVAADVKGSMTSLAKELRVTKGELFTRIDIGHEGYLRYSGMDPVLTYRIYEALNARIPSEALKLIPFEHKVALVCAIASRTGFLVDVDYSRKLSSKLKSLETRMKTQALSFGLENINSNEQAIEALERHGWTEFGKTEKGDKSVDKATLKAAMEGKDKTIAKLARSISEGKRAGKWRATWVDTFLNTMDSEYRCHPNINTLEARTGRMSITGIPAQTLPSGEASIRSCFVADPGHIILSTDYAAQELRVMAALSGDERMLEAFRAGEDLHQVTADAAGVDRKAGKGTNFAVVFGGGWKAVHDQFGVSEEDAKRAVKAFWETYPSVRRYADRATNLAKRNGYVTTPTGRRLYIDKDRPYSATNALVQSTARDITCRGLLRLHEAGFSPYIRLPIHDEIVFSVPEEHEVFAAKRTNELMQEEMRGLMVSTEAEASGQSWGSLYEDPDSNRKYTLT